VGGGTQAGTLSGWQAWGYPGRGPRVGDGDGGTGAGTLSGWWDPSRDTERVAGMGVPRQRTPGG